MVYLSRCFSTFALIAASLVTSATSASAVDVGGHTVTLVNARADYPDAGHSTWYYSVTSAASGSQISRTTFEVPLGCASVVGGTSGAGTWGPTQDNLTANTPSVGIGTDVSSGVTGVYYEESDFPQGATRNYYFVLDGNYAAEDVDVAIKAGPAAASGTIAGPSPTCASSEVDECALGTDNCDDNATCTNTPGSFDCSCNSGFFGDGIACSPCSSCPFGQYADQACTPVEDTVCAGCDGACLECSGPAATDCQSCAADHVDYAGQCVVVAAQSSNQQKCITALNKGAAMAAKTQGKEISACIKSAGAGKEADPDACLTRDEKGKVAKAKGQIVSSEAKSCGDPPDFGKVDAVAVGNFATAAELALLADVFGSDLGTTAVAGVIPAGVAVCQAAVNRAYEKVVEAKLKAFGKCKKDGLKQGTVDSAAGLGDCADAVLSDPKVAKLVGKLADTVASKCTGVSLQTAFPAECASAPDFAACVDERVECRVCLLLNDIDDLREDCDLFDDATANLSCP